MVMKTKQHQLFQASGTAPQTQTTATVGIVVDTNDPQQMGRVRAVCSQWGDTYGSDVEALPWAIYMPPFGGQVQVGTRGPGIQESEGGISYGMWAIPKVGSQVVVMCIDGNPMTRIYIGSVYDQFTPHTMPHGRFMSEDHPALEKDGEAPFPLGPYTSTEKLIQPLATNLKQQFGNKGEKNYEYRNRGADYQVTGIPIDALSQTHSTVADDKGVKLDDWTSTQGYQASRTDPHAPSSYTDKNYDSMVYSFTSPGFHAMSMDDRQENCRVRFRTTSGHQILMDDTNERIYISTAQGNNWIELDQDGNVDVYSSNNVSIHSAKAINMTADEEVRITGKKGVHIHSDTEIRLDALQDIHIKSAQNIRTHASAAVFTQSDGALHIKSGASIAIEAATTIDVKAGSNLNLGADSAVNANAGSAFAATAGANVELSAGGSANVTGGGTVNLLGAAIVGSGATVNFNGPPADAAATAPTPGSAQPAAESPAFLTSRIPDHEPWARTMTKDDTSTDPEFAYDDPSVNKVERGRTIERGMFWRR